jgi:hypothetical protein
MIGFKLIMPKKKINQTLEQQFQELIAKWRPAFGNQDDIDIKNYLERLALKSNSLEEIETMKANTVHLLKRRTGQITKTGV